MQKLFNSYIVIYFLTPSLLAYLAIFTGIIIPFYIEIIPFLFIIISKNLFNKLNYHDFLFSILLAACILFVVRNSDDYSWINNIEDRGMIFIAFNYCIFRFLLKKEWSNSICQTILKLLEISMYLMLLEFILININDLYRFIEAGYLNAYPQRNRLYESIVMFAKPFGLYPGTHNAGIAATISILYLLASKSISKNKAFFVASVVVFFICFSLTAFLVFLLIFFLLRLRHRLSIQLIAANSFYLLFICTIIYYVLMNYSEITQIRSAGEILRTENIPFSDAEYLYSINTAFVSLINSPFGVNITNVDTFMNEVYFSRVAQYYGITLIIFWIMAIIIVFFNLRNQNRSGLFFSISLLTLFFSSFHYASIISYPLTILVPLTFVFIKRRPISIVKKQTYLAPLIKIPIEPLADITAKNKGESFS